MKWVNIISSAKQEVYELCSSDKKLLRLIYSPEARTARIENEGEKRSFIIDKAGFLKNKTILRNEYGYKVGQLEPEKSNTNEGIIEIDDERLHYTINNQSELLVFKTSKTEPLISCQVTTRDEKKMQFKIIYPCLLMALCWYMFLPVAR